MNDRWSVDLSGVTLLRRYRVERKIGGGGMASVYLGHDEQLDLPVVVKVPHPAFLAEPGFRERFDRETRDLISLQHPHVVSILARGEHEDLPYLVMQFLKGGSLGDRMRQAKGGGLPLETVGPWVRDLARALDFIHAQGVVHRDIKPDNVLFDEHGHAFLSDFGIAKAVGGADTGLTVTGATPGSPAYMAPEQPRTSALTGASDQYSLAATIYEALSGHPTFEGETVVDVLVKKQSEEPVPLGELVPDLPPAVGRALARALAREPGARFPTCSEMVAAMLDDTRVVEVADPAPTPPATPPATTRTPTHAPTRVTAPPSPPSPSSPPRFEAEATGSVPNRTLIVAVVGLVIVAGIGFLALSILRVGEPADGLAPTPTPRSADTDVVGTYRIDVDEMKRRLKAHGKRPVRVGKTRRPPLENMAHSDLELTIEADGHFVLRNRDRPERPEVIRGKWARLDDEIVMSPDERASGPGRLRGETFKARITPRGLDFVRRGFELPLVRR